MLMKTINDLAKEVLDIEEEIEFVTEYVDNKDLPKGEYKEKLEKIWQELRPALYETLTFKL